MILEKGQLGDDFVSFPKQDAGYRTIKGFDLVLGLNLSPANEIQPAWVNVLLAYRGARNGDGATAVLGFYPFVSFAHP